MPIHCSCPECGYSYEVADELAGKTVLCPECQTRFQPKGTPLAVATSGGQPPAKRQGFPLWILAIIIPAGGCAVVLFFVVIALTRPSAQPSAWPSAQPGDMTLKEFILQKPPGPTAVQVDCELATHYNWAFRNTAQTHCSFRIVDKSTYAQAHVYAPKDSAYGQRMYEMLKDGRQTHVTLRIQRLGPFGQALPAEDDSCFALIGIVDSK